MKLNYDASPAQQAQQERRVMLSGLHRIEFHICCIEEGLFALIMLAGEDQQTPSRCKRQGPFHSRAQALAAINAIASELLTQGYKISESPAIWRLQAQAQLRENRKGREEFQVNTDFVPLGVMPDMED